MSVDFSVNNDKSQEAGYILNVKLDHLRFKLQGRENKFVFAPLPAAC